MMESLLVKGLFFHQCPYGRASFSVFYHRNLECSPLVCSLVESLELVSVVFILDSERLTMLDIEAQGITAEAGHVSFENISELRIMLHKSIGDLESRVDEFHSVL